MARSRKGSYTPSRGQFKGQTFKSLYAYRQANARAKGFPSYSQERKQRRAQAGKPPERRAPQKPRAGRVQGWRTVGGDAIDPRAAYRQYGSEEGPILSPRALAALGRELTSQYGSDPDTSLQFAVYGLWPNYGAAGEAARKWQTTNITVGALRQYLKDSRTVDTFMQHIFGSYGPSDVRSWSHRKRGER